MSLSGFVQLAISTVFYLLAAICAKSWALQPGMVKLLVTLALYTFGNLIMLRLIRDYGMSTAFSLSAVAQLVAVNAVALAFFGERLGVVQGTGVALAVVAMALITLGPAIEGR